MILNVDELLDQASDSEDKKQALRFAIAKNPAVQDVLHINFEETTFGQDLEVGIPSQYKYDENEPVGLSVTALVKERKFLKSLERTDILPSKKHKLWVNLLEALHWQESNVLIFAKDHALNELYPWLTKELYEDLSS